MNILMKVGGDSGSGPPPKPKPTMPSNPKPQVGSKKRSWWKIMLEGLGSC